MTLALLVSRGLMCLVGLGAVAAALLRLLPAVTKRSVLSRGFIERAKGALQRWEEKIAEDGHVVQTLFNRMHAEDAATHVLGLIGFVSWPVLVALNCVILGQIMELFVPTTLDYWQLPLLGEVQPLALLSAVIIAGCQAVLAVSAKASRSRLIGVIAGTGCVACVVLECYGGYVRGKAMEGLEIQQATAMSLLSGKPAVVAAAMGFAASLAEMTASMISFQGLLVPVGLVFLRIPRMLLLWCWQGFVRWVLGPSLEQQWVHLLPEIAEADRQSKVLATEAAQAEREGERLLSAATRLASQVEACGPPENQPPSASDRPAPSPESIIGQFEACLAKAKQEQAWVVTDPPPASAGRAELRAYRRARRWQLVELRDLVLAPVRRAHATALRQLTTLHLSPAGEAAHGLQGRAAQLRTELAVLRDRTADLKAETRRLQARREEIEISLQHALESQAFQQLDPRSRDKNLELATLSRARLHHPSGAAARLEKSEEHLAATRVHLEAVEFGLKRWPEATPGDPYPDPDARDSWRQELDQTHRRFTLEAEKREELIRDRETEARRRLWRLGILGRLLPWPGKWEEELPALRARPREDEFEASVRALIGVTTEEESRR